MVTVPRAGPTGAVLLAACLVGVADVVLTLVATPDPGLATYRLAYLLGPLLLALAWAVPVGLTVTTLGGRPGLGSGVVAAVWAGSVVLEAWQAQQALAALGVLALALGLLAVALARLAVDATAALAGLAAPGRRALGGATGVLFFVGALAAVPDGAASFGGGGGPCPRPDAALPRGPSVLLVTVDALRADAARTMQSYRRLAATGVELTQHVTTSPWTLPSVASLMTGLPLAAHGAGRSRSSRSLVRRSPIAAHVETLAARLGAHGYRTHAIVTNPFLTRRYGIDRGFCTFENVTMEGEAVRALGQTTLLRLARLGAPGLLPTDRAPELRRRAVRWLARHGDRPFFLWLHLLDPHAPYGDRAGAPTSLVLDLMAFQDRAGTAPPFRSIGLLRAGEYRPGPTERARIRALYREDVRTADRELGHLLDHLDATGLRGRVAIVLTADHGEEFWEHGGVEHGRTLYEEVLNVPLVLSVPGSTPRAEHELTSVVDVAPTILALAGAPELTASPGVNLLGRVPAARRVVLGELLFGEDWSGLRTPTHKYMRAEHGSVRVFDLTRDPGERVNRVALANTRTPFP